MKTGSQDEQVAKVLAGFTSNNDIDSKTQPSREGFGVSLDSLAEYVERELWRDRGRMRELNAGRRNCECDVGSAGQNVKLVLRSDEGNPFSRTVFAPSPSPTLPPAPLGWKGPEWQGMDILNPVLPTPKVPGKHTALGYVAGYTPTTSPLAALSPVHNSPFCGLGDQTAPARFLQFGTRVMDYLVYELIPFEAAAFVLLNPSDYTARINGGGTWYAWSARSSKAALGFPAMGAVIHVTNCKGHTRWKLQAQTVSAPAQSAYDLQPWTDIYPNCFIGGAFVTLPIPFLGSGLSGALSSAVSVPFQLDPSIMRPMEYAHQTEGADHRFDVAFLRAVDVKTFSTSSIGEICRSPNYRDGKSGQEWLNDQGWGFVCNLVPPPPKLEDQ